MKDFYREQMGARAGRSPTTIESASERCRVDGVEARADGSRWTRAATGKTSNCDR